MDMKVEPERRKGTGRPGRRRYLLLALGIVGVASLSPTAASAATYEFCNQTTTSYDWCPGGTIPFAGGQYAGARHTFKNERMSWGTTIKPGCTVGINLGGIVAYTNSNASDWKYLTGGCNYVTMSFPANTELLRLYGQQTNGNNLIVGRGDY